MNSLKGFMCALIGLLCITGAPRPVFADKTDTLIKTEMQSHQIPGLALAVVKNGRTVKMKGYGVANLEWNVPVTKDTVFEIGSVTKQFTAACVMLLVQDGKLSLEDKISKYLKDTPPAWSNITVRHLLTHTSGLKNYTALDGYELRNHFTQQKFIAKLAAEPLDFQPGDDWSYSNSGYNLLGYIVENLSGESYWSFLRERIFQPAGMTATRSREPAAVITNRAAGYELKEHILINRDYDLTYHISAGAIVSTIADMVKWDAALTGDKLLTQASKELWWSPMKLNNGKIQNYGFGWFLNTLEGHKNIGHGGSTSGFSATIQRFPDDHLSVIILCNADELDVATKIAKEIAKEYLPKIPANK